LEVSDDMKPTRRRFLQSSAGASALDTAGALVGAPDAHAEPAPEKKAVRIAVVQQEGNPGRVEENRTKALRYAAEALAHGADVILFHEELLIGYSEDVRKLAEPLNGPSVRAFRSALDGSKALVIFGLTEREADRYYIAATVVSAAGVVANYRKTHLWWADSGLRYEPGVYTPGDRLVTFNVGGHKSGLMICYDGDSPEMTRSYANLECRMLFWMNNRGSRGHQEVSRLATTNSMIMATSCCCGRNERGDLCRGGSNITDAQGKLLSEIWDREGVIYADVEPAEATRLRSANPWWRGQRGDLYHYSAHYGAKHEH
jgi:predicted amidohydrolase